MIINVNAWIERFIYHTCLLFGLIHGDFDEKLLKSSERSNQRPRVLVTYGFNETRFRWCRAWCRARPLSRRDLIAHGPCALVAKTQHPRTCASETNIYIHTHTSATHALHVYICNQTSLIARHSDGQLSDVQLSRSSLAAVVDTNFEDPEGNAL